MSDEKLRLTDVQPLIAKVKIKDGTREQIIRRIVAELHSNVRYTGVEFGESNLIPQFPSETLKRRYGDCKDKAALLVTMLRSAGIPANLALLDTGPGLDVNPDLPGMGGFDHAIVYVPPVGPDPEIWVDATAQYAQVGTLPWGDYGRRALVISMNTTSLVQTPELTSDQVVHRELREFTMAEYGPATIVETNEDIGPGDADARHYYNGDNKEIRKQAEKYVSEMYLADSLTSLEHGKLSNLEKPASVKYVAIGTRLTLVMAYAYSALERWPELLTSSEELVMAEPTSVHGFNLIVIAYRQLKRFTDWQKLVEQRMQKYPDEIAYVRSAAQLAVYRGEIDRSREITKTIIDKGKSNEQDLNLYAWYALFLPGPIATETLDMAHRESDLSKNINFSILHTLACVYAQAGKTTQAREYLLKAMDAAHMEEPDSAIWLGFALIAEQYGIFDAAGTMYRRVEKAKFEGPGTNYAVAQQHLAQLPTAASTSTISAKR